MTENEIIKQVRRIEIRARGLSQQMFSGEYHSAFKGRGMAFSEVREYQYGDDVRNIDWNVTARLNHPYVKVFEEERELTVMLLVDVSGSHRFGTTDQYKSELIAEIAATLAFSAIHNNDKVGVVMFSDRIEKFIPPQKGSSHILRIIRELIGFRPAGNGTDIAEALRYFTNVTKKRSTAFLLSDMYDDNYENALKIAAGKHDLVVLHIDDIRERQLPRMGLVAFEDLESGQTRWVDTSSEKVRQNYETYYRTYNERCANLMQKYGIDYATISTGQDFVKPLIGLFKRRGV
ncbi:MAG: DUF58 domain-containing protein [Bacteroidales bacterium]|nr:DUF58 domain-containing protein [Bacteroidales bacterium]MBR6330154.1 DUF58 domain-containing protein [Bacteroidales bacterium]